MSIPRARHPAAARALLGLVVMAASLLALPRLTAAQSLNVSYAGLEHGVS